MQKIILSIEGMTCSACSNGLEKYLNKQEKIKKATVNLIMQTASIECDNSLSLADLSKYVNEAGFKCLGPANLTNETKPNKWPFIVYGIIAILMMYISMGHMLNLPIIPLFNMHTHPYIYSLTELILTIPYLIFGFEIIKSGINNLLHKMPNMDSLVTIGIISSLLYSIYNIIMIFKGHPSFTENLYFESIVFVIYFIKLGRFININANEQTKLAIKQLVSVTPQYAKIKTPNGIKKITIDAVKKGDILVSFAGDKIAVDGIITNGNTHTDESFITGESLPVKKKKGDTVIAGSINYNGTIEYQAERIGKNSTISEIVNLVVEATNTKAPISLLADRICNFFVPIIILIATLTLIISLITHTSFNDSLTRFVSVLVVACPCALGLATPLAIVVAEGICVRNGLLVKTSESLELMSRINTIVFDKTGTLTNGNLTISHLNNYSKLKDEEILTILSSLESSSSHPIAKSIISYCRLNNIPFEEGINIKNIPGVGIKGAKDHKTYYAGNAKILKKLKIKNKYEADEKKLQETGNSIIYLIENTTILALLGIKDTIRQEAKETISKLQSSKIEIIMLTGDNEPTANIIAQSLGIKKVIANVLPVAKSDTIQKLKQDHKIVAMVGDGINDAPSLITSDVGISISSGTDIATDSADVILMSNRLDKIIDLINISKKTLFNIKENLFWAFFYNILMIPIACGIFTSQNITITPMLSSIAMIFSSLFVAINALRLKTIKLHNSKKINHRQF